ncbi:hypothetical protein MMC17_010201 [Xylographa soralifera]|nr:hypothetical protein [Xylographa soralifera]
MAEPAYRDRIESTANISTNESLFVTEHKRLAKFMRSSADTPSADQSDNFARVYELSGETRAAGISYTEYLSLLQPGSPIHNQLLFLAGYPSAALLVDIATHYGVDPEFFDRHLSFVDDSLTTCSIHTAHHVLPSQLQTVFQTSITSIGGQHGDPTFQNLAWKRADTARRMTLYLHNLSLGKGWKPHHSVVRRMEVHDRHRFSIDQYVTIRLARNKRDVNKWIAIVWIDVGADLADSCIGPWLSSSYGTSSAHFRPFTLYNPDTFYWIRDAVKQPVKEGARTGKLPQAILPLVKAYGESLYPNEMAKNPIYALHEVFGLICVSKLYYLDMTASVLDTAIAESSTKVSIKTADTRDILIHSHRLLEQQCEQICNILEFLRSLELNNIPRSNSNVTHTALARTVQDLEYLRMSAERLMTRCNDESAIISREIAAKEAGRGIEQSKSTHKVTLLAAVYVPLSFACSVFGPGLELQALETGAAVQLLQQQTRITDTETLDVANAIVKELHCYPLAVVQIAGIITRRQDSLSRFLEDWRRDSTHVTFYKSRHGDLQGYRQTLHQVMSLQQFSSECQNLLKVLSFLDPDAISEVILTTNPQVLDFPEFPTSPSRYTECLEELFKGSLSRRIPGKKELFIHRLVQDVVRSEILDSPGSFAFGFNASVQLISYGWPRRHRVADQCRELLNHIKRLWIIFEVLKDSERATCATVEFVGLLAEVAWYQYRRSDLSASLESLDQAMRVHKDSQQAMDDVLASLHNIGGAIAYDAGQPDEALIHIQAYAKLQTEVYAQNNVPTRELAAAYSELARAYMMNSIFNPVPDLLEKSIAIRKQVKDYNDIQLFNPLHQMGLFYLNKSKFDAASSYFELALRNQRQVYGPDDMQGGSRTATLLYQLGDTRFQQYQLDPTGQQAAWEQSLTYIERAKALYQKARGDANPQTAKAAFKLAMVHFARANHAQARTFLDEATAIYAKQPTLHYAAERARTTYWLARLRYISGDLVAARGLAIRAAGLRRPLIDGGDPRPAEALTDADFDERVVFWDR